jgi:hypothetical protein
MRFLIVLTRTKAVASERYANQNQPLLTRKHQL